MTIGQFLKTFKRLAKKGEWHLQDGAIRHKRTGCCPVSYVGRKAMRKRYDPTALMKPGTDLGIRSDARSRLANAADYGDASGESWRHAFVRNRFLEYAGLKERA